MATYVFVFGRLRRLEDKEIFEATFERVSREVVGSIKGIIRDELIGDSNDPSAYIMLSEWESKDAWATWQRATSTQENSTRPSRSSRGCGN